MNREDIIRMAREADLIDDSYASDWYVYQLERFAALVAAAPVQEPVAQGCTHPSLGCCSYRDDGSPARWDCVMCGIEFLPKPAAQRQWVGLTDEEVKHMLELFVIPPHHVEMVVRAIEAKLREKNGGAS